MMWLVKKKILQLEKTLLMGVVNITPDSFSDGGQFFDEKAAAAHAVQLARDGADILDLGAESSRPQAETLSANEELKRLVPVLRQVRQETEVLISIDTTKSEVAKVCLEEGADVINDVSSLHDSDGAIADVVSQYQAGLILMHRRGNAKTMQSLNQYDHLTADILSELKTSVATALRHGVDKQQIVIDPGLGFAKDAEQSLSICGDLSQFHSLGLPVLVGPSRKSFIGHVTGRDVYEREFGTAAVVAEAVSKGIQIIRVHNVKAMRDVILMAEAIRRKQYVGT